MKKEEISFDEFKKLSEGYEFQIFDTSPKKRYIYLSKDLFDFLNNNGFNFKVILIFSKDGLLRSTTDKKITHFTEKSNRFNIKVKELGY